jgi:hypothetical protein
MKSLRKSFSDSEKAAPLAGHLVVGPSPSEVPTSHGIGSRDLGIVITDIRDREDSILPGPVIESVARHLLEAISDLGLKATVATMDRSGAGLAESKRQHTPLVPSSRLGFLPG